MHTLAWHSSYLRSRIPILSLPIRGIQHDRLVPEWDTDTTVFAKRNRKQLDYKSSNIKKYASADDSEYIYGIAPCKLALQANRRKIYQLYVKDYSGKPKPNVNLQDIVHMAKKVSIPVLPSDARFLDKLCEGRPHQGAVMEVSPLRTYLIPKNQEYQSASVAGKNEVWLALNDIQDPMNFGAILRTSLLMGVNRVIVSYRNTSPLSAVVSKASAGAMEIYRIYAVRNLTKYLICCKENNWHVIGTVGSTEVDSCKAVSCQNFIYDGRPTILVLGNEGFGLSQAIKENCSSFLTIPTYSSSLDIDSLNVSVATGILLHSVRIQIDQQTKA